MSMQNALFLLTSAISYFTGVNNIVFVLLSFRKIFNTFSVVGRSGTSLEKMHTVRSDVPERLCNSCNAFGAKNVLKRLFSKRHWRVYVGMSQDILHTRLYKGFEGSQMLSFDDRRKE